MPSNYDNAAAFYDALSRVVFGKAIVRAQTFLLSFIPVNSSVLVVGGGTGWILEEIARIHPSGLSITYIELSANMIARAKKRSCGNNHVELICGPVEGLSPIQRYDVVITPFLFDSFTEDTLAKVFPGIHSLLKTNGLWLFCDFKANGTRWQRLLLKCMYLFFKMLCRIETTRMPQIEAHFIKYHYRLVSAKNFYGNFIASIVYQKLQT